MVSHHGKNGEGECTHKCSSLTGHEKEKVIIQRNKECTSHNTTLTTDSVNDNTTHCTLTDH
jgi:hypothetical protein